MLSSLPSVSTSGFDIDSGDPTRQLLDGGNSAEPTYPNERDQGDEYSNQDREPPHSGTGVKVLDALFQIYLKMRNQTDEKPNDGDDVLNNKEFVGSTYQLRF